MSNRVRKARKGNKVWLGTRMGIVIHTGVNKLFVDFGGGFTCLVRRNQVQLGSN